MVTGKGNFTNNVYGDIITDNVLCYDTDMVQGESGGPIYIYGTDTVIGINTTYHYVSDNSTENYNYGLRLTINILNFIYNHDDYMN